MTAPAKYPELPTPSMFSAVTGLAYYGDDQMRAYADAAREQDRARAAAPAPAEVISRVLYADEAIGEQSYTPLRYPVAKPAPPPAVGVSDATVYVEVRECDECGHIDINEDNDNAACNTCDWTGPSPKEDCCPGCKKDGVMTSACPKCGCRSHLLGSADVPAPASNPEAPADERERLRAGQTAAVMPHIGPLLDAWEGMSNYTKTLIREEAPGVAKHLSLINRAMEDAPSEAPANAQNRAEIEHVSADVSQNSEESGIGAPADDCGNCFEGETDRGHKCKVCGGTGAPAEESANEGGDVRAFLDLASLYCAVTETPSGDLEWSFRQRDMENLAAEVVGKHKASLAALAAPAQGDAKVLAERGSPDYINALADIVDPKKLWRWTTGLEQLPLTERERHQVDAGVYLRRHAAHIERLRGLIGTGKSLLLTPLSPNGTDVRSIDTPEPVASRAARQNGGA